MSHDKALILSFFLVMSLVYVGAYFSRQTRNYLTDPPQFQSAANQYQHYAEELDFDMSNLGKVNLLAYGLIMQWISAIIVYGYIFYQRREP